MNNYDLNILSHHEFELLTRDLLQKKFGLFIESFAAGKDYGIDLRFAHIKNRKSIVQCKRYTSFKNLMSSLKKELPKIQVIDIDKYYLSTSLGLNPQRKDKIKCLLSPFIADTKDIFGRDDLNNMLGEFKEIELKYYKLWLSSSNVLSRIVYSKVINTTQFEKGIIERSVKTYVQNDSFQRALDILQEHRFVIISGIPGIGKTTLARVLVFHFLSKEYDEFASLDYSIGDAFSLFHEEKKQIFLYDDFLGKNFLEEKLSRNEDTLLYKFINQVKDTKNKLLIMTTREYILKQAQRRHEILNRNQFEIGKYILDLSNYTKWIRAQIFYNHLYFSNIKENYIDNLLTGKSYLRVINHKNYNPRIIETVLESDRWKQIDPENFMDAFIQYLDNPRSVWEHAFENQISQNARYLLLIMLTLGTPVLLEDLFKACMSFFDRNSAKYSININESDYRSIIKEIDGSFITTRKDSESIIAVDFINPSITDFILIYLSERKYIISDLIDSAIFQNQFFQVFVSEDQNEEVKYSRKIHISVSDKQKIVKSLIDGLERDEICLISMANYKSGKRRWYKYYGRLIARLAYISNNISGSEDELMFKISNNTMEYIKKGINAVDIDNVINIYINLHKYMDIDAYTFISQIVEQMSWIMHIDYVRKLNDNFPIEYDSVTKSEFFKTKIDEIVTSEYENADEDNFEYLISEFEMVEEAFGLDTSDKTDSLKERLEEIRERIYENYDPADEFDNTKSDGMNSNEDVEIDLMFQSLKEK